MDLRPRFEPVEQQPEDDGMAQLAVSESIPDGRSVELEVVVQSEPPYSLAAVRPPAEGAMGAD